ncbi:hypothetical protein CLHUN_26710 [Ruminiclostridium hungatei]|uniref:DUF2000 domain-containing protein n=1 Tax=Ruminiclostridium hungatei TaxID=48256 RepID=A0A1V4SI88_RUMHU|nr:DUF2000 domain-containing protein [Ruminiclostridium hungatei]OPX43524.1 hypothetical protein CLHUN_26710 [Ruminiclostridium hungatei]
MSENVYEYNEKKIVAILSSKISPEVALNVIGHLAISLGAYSEGSLMGRTFLVDKSNIKHPGISKYPFICTKVKPGRLRSVIEDVRTNHPDIKLHDFPKQMLETGHDDELAQAIEQSEENEMEYLGAIIYGSSSEVNLITGKFTLWRAD